MIERISTGSSNLDLILSGGFPRNSINIVMGAPGSGKTILAEQLAFANAGPDCRVLYLSTLSEPLPKLVSYLQSYTFVDIGRIGSDIIYHSLSDHSLREGLSEDPKRLHAEIFELITKYRPRIIIIDSYKAIADLLPDPQVWRRTSFELAGMLSAYGTTSFWVGEYTWETGAGPTEFAIADGIIELQRVQRGSRDERYLRVAKLRGSSFFDGKHAFWISAGGLHVFPRFVTPPVAPDYQVIRERLQTGVDGLDAMVQEGWLRGSTTLIQGPSGAGKSMLALHFLRQGVRDGEPALLVNFQENPVQVRRTMRSLGWDPDELLGPSAIDHLYTSPVELQIDTIVEQIFRRIAERGIKRVVIDAIGDLEKSAPDRDRFDDYIYSMIQHFAAANVAAVFTVETYRGHPEHPSIAADVSYMSDNIVSLSMDLGEDLQRRIRIIKTRGSAHDGRRRILHITSQGVSIE
ncbi:MAG: ATPase domain-containing protein [Enhygromyxa sp.]